MTSFTKFIGKLPFSGKLAIRPLAYRFYLSTTSSERKRSYLALLALLAFYVLTHAVQAEMGTEILRQDSPIWAKVIAGIYAVVNTCVTLTQIHLCLRATHYLFLGHYPRIQRSVPEWSDAETKRMVSVTFIGQAIFLVVYILFK
ncbi:MAG: hypothetical protein HGA31_02770 [Candidatus Moranbacteria bacterium]|nr:hypothetical protein [Candidatus Moranbacteria bacterium]